MTDSVVDYPDLWMQVYVAGNKFEEMQFSQWLVQGACSKAMSVDEADLVIFTGGYDVNPALYGEDDIHPETRFSEARDIDDIRLWEHCVENGIPMLGVCRGMQFGNVMKGGKLYQDVSDHYGDHQIWDKRKGFSVDKVSSVHHQMVRPGTPGMDIIADCYISETKDVNNKMSVKKGPPDIEAIFFRDVCFFGVQGHPEYRGYSRYSKWVLDYINELVIENPDIDRIKGCLRIKPELRVNSEVTKVLEKIS